MSLYIVAPAARDDLLVIWNHYAQEIEDPDLADRVSAEIVEAFHKLARAPGLGHFRSDLSEEPLRFWAVRKFLIVYRSEAKPIQIVRVLHGARDVQAILGENRGEE